MWETACTIMVVVFTADQKAWSPITKVEFDQCVSSCIDYRRDNFGRMKISYVIRHPEEIHANPSRPLTEHSFLVYDVSGELRIDRSSRIFRKELNAWTEWSRPQRFIVRNDVRIVDSSEDTVLSVVRIDTYKTRMDLLRLIQVSRPQALGMHCGTAYEPATFGIRSLLGRPDLVPKVESSGRDDKGGRIQLSYVDANDLELHYEIEIDIECGPSIVRTREFRIEDGVLRSEVVNEVSLSVVKDTKLWFVDKIKRTGVQENRLVYEDLVTVMDVEVPGDFTPEVFDLKQLPISKGRILFESTKPAGENLFRWNGEEFIPHRAPN